jgi:hypothetical protein
MQRRQSSHNTGGAPPRIIIMQGHLAVQPLKQLAACSSMQNEFQAGHQLSNTFGPSAALAQFI